MKIYDITDDDVRTYLAGKIPGLLTVSDVERDIAAGDITAAVRVAESPYAESMVRFPARAVRKGEAGNAVVHTAQ